MVERLTSVRPSFLNTLTRAGFEEVANVTKCFQVCGVLRIGFNFLPQPADIHVHAPRCYKSFRAPNSIEQLIPRESVIRARCKEVQQAKFQCTRWDQFSGEGDAVRQRVNSQLSDLNGFLWGRLRNCTPQERLYARPEFAWAKGFCDVFVSTQFQPHDAVGFFAFGRQNQNWKMVQLGVPANLFADLEA